MASRRRTTTRVTVSTSRGVFMISVAAELAEMHPQTLRMYEARGLIEPKRSPKGTRLYSQEDVERLRRIQEMTNELGLNLAGVERVLALEQELERTTPPARGARGAQPAYARGARGRGRARARVAARRSSCPTAAARCLPVSRRIPVRRDDGGPGAPDRGAGDA